MFNNIFKFLGDLFAAFSPNILEIVKVYLLQSGFFPIECVVAIGIRKKTLNSLSTYSL